MLTSIGAVSFDEAIKAAERRGVVLPEIYYGELQKLARQLSFSIAGLASLDQLDQVKSSLSEGLQRGVSFNKWKKEMLEDGILDLPDHRLDNIFRTNIQNSYNRGRWERFDGVKNTRPFLMYDAINDSRVRPPHLAMDGIIREQGDKFWHIHAPSNGYGCRCRLISLTAKQAARRSGNGQGLNKRVNSKAMQPDEGWDYNPAADLTTGIERAIRERPKSLFKTTLVSMIAAFIELLSRENV